MPQTLAGTQVKFKRKRRCIVRQKLSTILLVCVCLLGLNASLWGQNGAAARGIHGYLDPQTGVFHALPLVSASDSEPPALTTVTGKFVVNFTITVSSTIASTLKISCGVTATVLDSATLNEIIESATVVATRSGSTATCSVTIPYSWNLGSSTTDKVSLGYQIIAPVEATGSSVLPNRLSEQTAFATIAVPATGSTTTETLTPTI